jgi:predicted GIY-YIG superfamily endonuclease
MESHYCYILGSTTHPHATYNGYTNRLSRRLRQHNREIVGGARSTSRNGPWKFIAILTAPGLTKSAALSLEWHLRYPTNRRPRPSQYSSPKGRLDGIPLALQHTAAVQPLLHDMVVYVDMDFLDYMKTSYPTLNIRNISELLEPIILQ